MVNASPPGPDAFLSRSELWFIILPPRCIIRSISVVAERKVHLAHRRTRSRKVFSEEIELPS